MLKGRNAVVTGSTSGIGEGVARALAAQGANVMLNGFGDAKAIEELRSGMEKQYGVKVFYNPADLSKAEDCETLIRDAEKQLGAVDILVNNAGVQFVSNIEDFPVDRWNQIIAINLSSTFHTIRAALPGMKKRGWGRLINTASTHGLVASAGKVAYVAAKHGVIGITQTVALETATSGITCNAICPGWVLTPLVQKQIDDRAAREGIDQATAKNKLLGEKQPSLRFTQTSDIGALAVFLCSEGAQNLTGASLPVDGGWTAQ
ncbi:MAG TPA: 3-hydroxybutyrate dehydrogenase [Candidatus Saccharimonadales bacterium]|nr:3-hydroxybutyrate dehydrogenase [Candidatus Saccharimonadales bacterium]